MRRKITILIAVLISLQLCNTTSAFPTTAHEAEMAVAGWLKANPQPLDAVIGREIKKVETFSDDNGQAIYYIVYLEPSGFVIVSADDLIEPIIGFVEEGPYDPSGDNPLGALVNKDLSGRMKIAHNNIKPFATAEQSTAASTQNKWNQLINLAQNSEDNFITMGITDSKMQDVRVAPLVESKWSQELNCAKTCYNYYTPNNYPCGCVATAMAQLMRCHQYPTEPNDNDPNQPDSKRSFAITVFNVEQDGYTLYLDETQETLFLRGGDGNGGPYEWELMEAVLCCSTTPQQRQAIGALCYDAGIAAGTFYSEFGSGTNLFDAKRALLEIFEYSNGINACNDANNLDREHLMDMVNPNLDAGCPVILAISKQPYSETGHAVLADGYGYNSSTLYHHINMGWGGRYNAWYNLHTPLIDAHEDATYSVIDECAYNIFTTKSGEIISGRVTNCSGQPVTGAVVTATGTDGDIHTDETNSKGIYALAGLNSNSTYTISVTGAGYDFAPVDIETGISTDGTTVSGNRWAVDFKEVFIVEAPACSTEDFETNDFEKFPWTIEPAPSYFYDYWITTSPQKHSGMYGAAAGGNTYSRDKNCNLSVRLDCISDDITFYYKVSVEPGDDFLIFSIDGEEKGRWTGEEDWTKASFPVAAGTRTFKWRYSTDQFRTHEYDNMVCLDDIVFPIDCLN